MICMTFRSRPRLILKDSCLYRVFTWGRGYVVLYNMGYVFASHTPMYMRHSHSHSSCISHLLLVDLGVPPQASSIRCPAYYMRRATVQAQQHATVPLPVGGELTGRDNRSPPPDSLQIICKNPLDKALRFDFSLSQSLQTSSNRQTSPSSLDDPFQLQKPLPLTCPNQHSASHESLRMYIYIYIYILVQHFGILDFFSKPSL